jgi:hypothetical protein
MPHQIEYPFPHDRKIDVENSQCPIKIENDGFDRREER